MLYHQQESPGRASYGKKEIQDGGKLLKESILGAEQLNILMQRNHRTTVKDQYCCIRSTLVS